jgi:anti-anti-sigma factor
MNLSAKRVGDADVVEVKGQVDVSTIANLEEFISELDARELVIDMTEVNFMDTTGVRFLLGLASRFTSEERSIRLVLREQSPVLLLLKITGLSDQFMIVEPGETVEGESP